MLSTIDIAAVLRRRGFLTSPLAGMWSVAAEGADAAEASAKRADGTEVEDNLLVSPSSLPVGVPAAATIGTLLTTPEPEGPISTTLSVSRVPPPKEGWALVHFCSGPRKPPAAPVAGALAWLAWCASGGNKELLAVLPPPDMALADRGCSPETTDLAEPDPLLEEIPCLAAVIAGPAGSGLTDTAFPTRLNPPPLTSASCRPIGAIPERAAAPEARTTPAARLRGAAAPDATAAAAVPTVTGAETYTAGTAGGAESCAPCASDASVSGAGADTKRSNGAPSPRAEVSGGPGRVASNEANTAAPALAA